MKNFLFLLLTFGMFTLTACGDDDSTTEEITTDYHIHFITPAEDGTSTSMQGQTLSMDIEVEDHNDGTVHHVNVKVYKKDDASVVLYDGPSDAHVHAMTGKYEFKHNLVLDPTNVDGHTDWVVEVKAWGHEAGAGEVTASTMFHVHPM